MDLSWIRDYGAFVAASIAATVTVLSGILNARRERKHRHVDWLRDARLPRYVEFIRAAQAYVNAIFWYYGERDPDIVGPPPEVEPDLDLTGQALKRARDEVRLAGPAEVAKAARLVQYAIWEYRNRLEGDPFSYSQVLFDSALDDFIAAAQESVGISDQAVEAPSFSEWKQSVAD